MRTRFWIAAAASVAVGTGGLTAAPPVAAEPPGFTNDPVVATTFDSPTSVKVLPGGALLVLQKNGALRLVGTDGSVSDAGQFPVCSNSERGLLSAALDPGFATNGVLYLYLTRDPGGGCRNTLVKTTFSGGQVDVAGAQVLIDNIQWTAGNHNGGTVEVGHDGHLYLSVGEGAETSRAQDLSSLGGKILRITTDGDPAPGNPFLTAAGHGPCARAGQSAPVCEEIYAYGLRNPFRMAFDPNSAGTRFHVNDVGSSGPDRREEVNEGAVGADYGWPDCEGPCADPAVSDPVTSYPPASGSYIVGGAFIPDGWWGSDYDGGYLFADGGTNNMWLLPEGGSVDYGAPFETDDLSVATELAFGVRNGERALFYVNNGNGQLRKIVGPNAATSDPAGPAYLGGAGGPDEPTVPPSGGPGLVFTAYPTAERVFDSRNGIGGPTGTVTGGQTRTVPLGVPDDATAALVNITLDNATPNPEQQCSPGSYLVAWQPGTSMPATSNANVGPCDVAANVAVLAVDDAGATEMQVYADTHVILDVLGYYVPADGAVAAGRFAAVTPSRLLDTRAAVGPANPYDRADTGNESVVRFPVTGRAGVPADATTVSLTVTAIGPGSDASGYVTAYAGGTARPATSTVNHTGGFDTRANLALVPVGADGTVELYLYQVANVVVDVGGWITSSADPAAEAGRLRLTAPTRIADSRNGLGVSPLTPHGQVVLEPAGVPAGASAIVQNVTMASHAPGWICATPNPWTGGDVSIQNARQAGQDRPAMTFTTLGQTGAPRLRYCSQDLADVIVDVFGWYE